MIFKNHQSKILYCSSYLPKKVFYNDDLKKYINTSDEWIRSRTGIVSRHISEIEEKTEDLGIKAVKNLVFNLENQNKINDIDLILVATSSHNKCFPSIATKIHQEILSSSKEIPAFDIQAACSGFIYGLEIADNFIKSGKYKSILFVTPEKMSSLINWEDRSTCILFGDGASACIIEKSNDEKSKFLDIILKTNGKFYDFLYTEKNNDTSSLNHSIIKMKGQNVFKNAIEKMSSIVEEILNRNNINFNQVKFFIFHQANARIIQNIKKKFNIDEEKIVITIDKHANCSAASIPLAINHLLNLKRIKRGDLIATIAFGAGFTWGAALITW